ncbi:MAG: chorismate-binding protein [Magnetococcales bacterium]|nr:chorismate-binding protein [Magnetococcales bacterium]
MAKTLLTAKLLTDQICFLADFPGHKVLQLLTKPSKILTTSIPEEVPAILQEAEYLSQAGEWVGGFISYEAGGQGLENPTWPLVWFACFTHTEAVYYPHPDKLEYQDECSIAPLINEEQYQADLEKILGFIQAGDSYQVNHTISAKLVGMVDIAKLFLKLQPQHRFPYAAWLNTGQGLIASFSPEMLLTKEGDKLLTAPIKGTRPNIPDGWALGEELQKSKKDRAEHVMIVDMARNDLGRICAVGSVQVPHLFELRQFSTVYHLESRVAGKLLPGTDLSAVIAAMFPAASITGAPKKRTMEIIKVLEGRERGVYTGSIGLLKPGGDYVFNVAIRTVTQKGSADSAYVGLGGGIVADSDPGQEWAEIADKGAFLNKIPVPFGLIETFLVDSAGEIEGLDLHLQRIEKSALQLGFACDLVRVERGIGAAVAKLGEGTKEPRIMRMELSIDGRVTFSNRPYIKPPDSLKVLLAVESVDRFNHLLQHKTTRRGHFDRALKAARGQGYDEVLFMNGLGRITEGAIRGVLVCIAGRWYAPPVADGLLPSIWRAREMKNLDAEERSMGLDEIAKAEKIIMGNAVQGSIEVKEITVPSIGNYGNTKK